MHTFPSYDELETMPNRRHSQSADLRVDHAFGPTFSTVRLWTERGDTADGHPFDQTVTVEIRGYIGQPDADTWSDLGQYDGSEPPTTVAGYRVADLFRNADAGPERWHNAD